MKGINVFKILKYVFGTLVVLIGLILAAATFIWFNLDLLLTEKQIIKYKNMFMPANMTLEWQSLDVRVESLSFATRRFLVDSKGLCFKWDSNHKVHACFTQALIEFDVRLLPKPQLMMLRSLTLVDEKIEVKIASSKKTNEPTDYPALYSTVLNSLNQFEFILNQYQIGALQLEIDNFGVFTESRDLHISLSSIYRSGNPRFPFELRIKAEDEEELDLLVKMNLDVAAQGGKRNEIVVDLKGRFEDKNFTANLRWDKNLYSPEIDYKLKFGFKKKSHAISDIEAFGKLADDEITLNFSQGAVYLPPPLKEVSLHSCDVKIEIDRELNTEAKCKPRISWEWKKQVYQDVKKICKCIPPSSIGSSIEVSGPLQLFLDPKSKSEFKFSYKIDDFIFQFLKLTGNATGKVFRSETGKISVAPIIAVNLNVEKFDALVKMLEPSSFAIPAPFHVLRGKMQMSLDSITPPRPDQFATKLKLRTELQSKTQVANLTSELDLVMSQDFKPPYSVKGDILIEKLYLELPPVYPTSGLPHILKSGKIKNSKQLAKAQTAVPKVEYDITIKTQNQKSLRLASNLAKPFIPIILNLRATTNQVGGEINLRPFQIESFGRTTYVDQLKLVLPKLKNEDPELDADLRLNQSGYEIFIKLVGQTDDLQIFLRSNPMLPRSDIISVLLYGRTFNNLEGQQRDNVGNAGAAIADRAIGLFGIWAFASTPIQSVAYNPSDKSYSAQLKVSDETVLSIGTDWERVQNLELRRHLFGNWLVVTSYEPGEEDEPGKGSLFLQWQKFY